MMHQAAAMNGPSLVKGLLQRKSGALRNGAPFAEMPSAFRSLQQHLLKRPGGDREMVEILSLVLQHDEQVAVTAVELALQAGVPTKTHILIRTVSDLPCSGRRLELLITTRRFVCTAGDDENYVYASHVNDLTRGRVSECRSTYFLPPLLHTTTTSKYLLHNEKSSLCLVSAMSKASSRRQRDHARTRPYRPSENRSRPHRSQPLHRLPQNRRGHFPSPAKNQHERRWLARVRY